MNKLIPSILKFASVQGVLIGVYHIILPYQWNWYAYTADLPPMIEWSLYALNNFFSVLLILLSLVAFREVIGRQEGRGKIPLALMACLLFWVIDCVYQVVVPVPAPPAYAFIKYLFFGAALLNAMLYLLILLAVLKK